MIFVGQGHKIVVMDAINYRGLDRMNDEMTWCSLKKTCNGQKELFIQCQPFRYFFTVFVIINTCNSFFNKVQVI